MEVAGFEIENKSGFWSALIGLIASLVMAMGNDGLLGGIADATSEWGDVKSAVVTLHSYDVNSVGDNSYSVLRPSDEGFNKLSEVLSTKVPWLRYSKPDLIVMNTVATFGGSPKKVVHARAKGQSQVKAIADFYIVDDWITQSKSKDYLYKGLFLLIVSFGIGISQFVRPI
ncbi:hypothetical protein ACRRS0_12500 [Agarivorans sp. QJM3NY_29]|uniref:hypothetical protein n=1 Tax=unclassified Agarivorans TaxID=2636026 RepID=UPI003D7C3A4A